MELAGSWFAVVVWAVGWKVLAFLGTWVLLGVVVGWVVGGAAKLGGDEDVRR